MCLLPSYRCHSLIIPPQRLQALFPGHGRSPISSLTSVLPPLGRIRLNPSLIYGRNHQWAKPAKIRLLLLASRRLRLFQTLLRRRPLLRHLKKRPRQRPDWVSLLSE